MEIKKTIRNSVAITGPLIPFGSQITLNVGSDQKLTSLVDLSSAELRITINVTGTGGQNYTICKPYISWITTYTFTPTFKGEEGKTRSVIFSGNPGRGDIGYVYALCDKSAYNTLDSLYNENLTPPFVTNRTTFDISIPLRYLIDPLCTKRYLPISYFSFVPTFDTLLSIFSPPATSPAFAVTATSYHLDYPSYVVKSMPIELMYPDPRLTFIQKQTFANPVTTLVQTINVPGKLIRILYFMVQQTESSAAGTAPNPYNFSPNPSSVVTQHQLTGTGKVYPLNPVYSAVFNATTETGLQRHYHEFLQSINKFQPSSNTYLTYTYWRDNVRIYTIEVNDDGLFQQSILNFQAQLSAPTVNQFDLYIVSQYVPSIANLTKDAKLNQSTIE